MKSFDAQPGAKQVEEAILFKVATFVNQQVGIEDDFEELNQEAAKHFKRWLANILSNNTDTLNTITNGEFYLDPFVDELIQ